MGSADITTDYWRDYRSMKLFIAKFAVSKISLYCDALHTLYFPEWQFNEYVAQYVGEVAYNQEIIMAESRPFCLMPSWKISGL